MRRIHEFHEGEVLVQERTGERAIALRNGAPIADRITGGAVPFLAQQRFVVIGADDDAQRPWASLLFGGAGFVSTQDGRTVEVRRGLALEGSDAVIASLRPGAQLGMLAIDLGTRRRLRVNGRIERVTELELVLTVREAYRPKYIQRRLVSDANPAPASIPDRRGSRIDANCARLLDGADTFFVATRHADRGIDASHRGGRPGFIQRVDELTLRIPDYRGNSMYNTLGNLVLDDRAGISVPDFGGGSVLQMTGRASLLFDQPEDTRFPTGGTGRYLEFRVEEWKMSPLPRERAWDLLDYSPFCPISDLREP